MSKANGAAKVSKRAAKPETKAVPAPKAAKPAKASARIECEPGEEATLEAINAAVKKVGGKSTDDCSLAWTEERGKKVLTVTKA